jgi:choline dehydrogenase-like flavoprotein
MGGGVTARALAEAGHDVLLVDRGNQEIPTLGIPPDSDESERRLAEGQWPTLSAFEVDGVVNRCFAPIGSGLGGSTNLYAAALERFERLDVDSLPESPHPTGGWPIGYDELLPCYEQAERMFHVAGTADPLSPDKADHLLPPPPLGACDADFVQSFENSGLHPYRLHVGIRYLPGCDECLGRLCTRECRASVRSILAEAPRKPTIWTRAEVVKLRSSQDSVTEAVLRQGNEEIVVRAKVFVLAAGAVHTPKILLHSQNEHWPDGLANRSGMVGRNLMFHAIQNFVLWPGRRLACTGPRKSISFRDLYHVDGERCGLVQSTGFEMGYGEYLMHLYGVFDRTVARAMRFVRPFLRIPAALTIRLFGRGTIFVCIVEDRPYPENRVVLDDEEADGVRLKYTIKDELRHRLALFRDVLRKRLGKRRMFFLSDGVELNFGHPCGTCVMSNDPAIGVVDRNCRAHGITNLFITDASFMPTSAAANPSLTIAANALRVSSEISRAVAACRAEASVS